MLNIIIIVIATIASILGITFATWTLIDTNRKYKSGLKTPPTRKAKPKC